MAKLFALALTCVAALMFIATPAAMATIVINGISPNHGSKGTTVTCTVYGSFRHPTNVLVQLPKFSIVPAGGMSITGTTTGILESTGAEAYVTFDIPATWETGYFTLTAAQTYNVLPYEEDTASLTNAFYIQQPPVITFLSQTSAVAGSGDLTLAVNGRFFLTQTTPFPWLSQVQFDGVGVPTDANSDSLLTAHIPASALTTPGTAQVTVLNPGVFTIPASLSNQAPFVITVPTPTVTSLQPASAVAGGPAFDLGVTGTGFIPGASGAVVRWNGAALVTTRGSATHLTAAVPASLIAAKGSATITVRNGTDPGAPVSGPLTFTIADAAPALTSITPTQVWAGYVKNDLVLTVNGSNFLSGAHIFLNGGDKPGTAFTNASRLTVPLTAADIATPGSLTVSVRNPPFPPGTPSIGTLPLVVAPETTDPTVTISGADSTWHNAPVTLTFGAADSQSGVQKVQYQSPPTVPTWIDGTTYTVPTTTQGAITVTVQALDWSNRVGTASATVRIDTTKPGTATLSDATVKKGRTARLKYLISEPSDLSPTANVVIKIARRSGGVAKTLAIKAAPTNAQLTFSFKCTLAKGTYTWQVYATDLAGNTQASVAKAKLTVK